MCDPKLIADTATQINNKTERREETAEVAAEIVSTTAMDIESGTSVPAGGGQERIYRRQRKFYYSLYLFMKMSNTHLVRQKKTLSAVMLTILGLGFTILVWYNRDQLASFLEWLSSIGVWGNILFILVFIIVGFPFMLGYIPLTVGAGYLYGMVMGTVTVSIGATTGACVAFWLCRTLTKKWIEKHLSSNAKFNLFMVEVENNAWKITLLTRLLPFPFGLVNGLFALSSISFPVFLVGSFVGLLPFQLMWTYFGTTLRSITEAVNGEMPFGVWQQFLLLVQIALGIGLALYLFQLGRGAMMVPEPGDITVEKVEEEEEIKQSIVFSDTEYVVVDVPAREQGPFIPNKCGEKKATFSPTKMERTVPYVMEKGTFGPNKGFADRVATAVMTRDSFIENGRKFGKYRGRARSFTKASSATKNSNKKCLSRMLEV